MQRVMSALAAALFLAIAATPAFAHVEEEVEGHQVVVGWINEPAYAGSLNGVEIEISHDDGEPVTGAKLQVELTYGPKGSGATSAPLSLEPAWDQEGLYEASVVPTEPGSYTFRIFGTLEAGEEFDETFTSGPRTFSDIEDPAPIEFPGGQPETEPEPVAPSDEEDASLPAMPVAVAGVVLGIIAIVIALRRKA